MSPNSAETRILTAARRLFFEHGFEKVSTDVLAREAAVSKATIYRHFENMADILCKVAQAEAVKFCETVPQEIETRQELHHALTQYGNNLLNFLNSAEIVEFVRLMHEAARANPEIGIIFFKAAYGRTLNDFGKMFTAGQVHGVITDDASSLEIAEDFLGLLKGLGMIRVQLGVSDMPFNDIAHRVDRAVATILKMHCK